MLLGKSSVRKLGEDEWIWIIDRALGRSFVVQGWFSCMFKNRRKQQMTGIRETFLFETLTNKSDVWIAKTRGKRKLGQYWVRLKSRSLSDSRFWHHVEVDCLERQGQREAWLIFDAKRDYCHLLDAWTCIIVAVVVVVVVIIVYISGKVAHSSCLIRTFFHLRFSRSLSLVTSRGFTTPKKKEKKKKKETKLVRSCLFFSSFICVFAYK